MGEIHDRMPGILDPGDHQSWLAGSPEDALALCAPYGGQMVVERTAEPWTGRSGQSTAVDSK
jgi:putative SOS response-associated peptidase YedK